MTQEDLPDHVLGAKFLRPGLDVEERLWPRYPSAYSPSNKFRQRMRELKGMITQDDIEAIFRYGELYAAAKSCASFYRNIRGVGIYIIVEGELKKDTDLSVRPAREEYPDLTQDDFNYRAVTLWPYIINRSEAWSMGWPGELLEFIEELAQGEAY